MNIYLIGYMGAGKSKIGKRLAAYIQHPFFDLDECLESHFKMSVKDFFLKYSEKTFRKAETYMLRNIKPESESVISLGGGTPCFHDNMEWIKSNGFSVYLKLNEKELFSRLINSKKNRPLLQKKEMEKWPEIISKQLKIREEFYTKADLCISGLNVDIKDLWKQISDRMKKNRENGRGKIQLL